MIGFVNDCGYDDEAIELAFRTGKRHDDGIKLLCHLHEWLGKALGEL